MKYNWKRLLALVLAALMMLSMTGLSEEEAIIVEDGASIDEALTDDVPVLDEQLEILDSLTLDSDLDIPAIDETAGPEATIDDEITTNALVKKVKLGVNEKYTLDTSSLSGKLTFKSTKPEIAAVNKKGIIKGKKVGSAKVVITDAKGKKYRVAVTVAKAPLKVTMSKKQATMEVGDKLQLKATLPAKTASNKMTWTSSNKRVATVTTTGKVTAVAAGTATITVKTFNGKKATCKVTVEEEEEEPLITLNKTNISLSVGDTATVKVTYLGDGSIYWTTSTSGIVSCKWGSDWVGDTCELYITGESAGSTVVTVEDRDAGYSASLNVTVTGSTGYTGDMLGTFGLDIDDVQYALADALSYYTYDADENQYVYTNDYMLVLVSDVTDRIEGIFLSVNTSGKYTLCGIHPGMNLYTAQSKATEARWSYYKYNDNAYYYTGIYKGEDVALVISTESGSSQVKNVYMFKI